MEKENKETFDLIPKNIQEILKKQGLSSFRPSQEKSIKKGLFQNNHNQLIVSPTGSGKTLVAELAMLDTILNKKQKVIYIVPLKALASEKYREFKETYGDDIKIRISIGELQNEKYNYDYDLLLITSEKLDSLIRSNISILNDLGLVIIDEIHLIHDEKRGPTLEVLISIFKTKFNKVRLIGLSATIKNYTEFAKWLSADLIKDDFRPVELQQFILYENDLKRVK